MNARFSAFLAALTLLAAGSEVADAAARVHYGVHRALREQGTVNLVVELAQTTESTLESIKEGAFSSRTARIQAVADKLQAQSQLASAEVTRILSQESSGSHGGFQSFWISNQVYVEAASFELVEKLAGLNSVGAIREQIVIKMDKPILTNTTDVSNKELVGQEWGIKRIGAQKVWADGNIGQGVVVANLDTGVRGTHEALKRNFRGAYGWYDPGLKSAEPNDPVGHGTHTMGTIAGSKGIGVAPGATWMACKVCDANDCFEREMLACAQFVLCPTDTQGNNPDCSKAPHVVSNSWGYYNPTTFFDSALSAWAKAGIVAVFSAGNAGEDCGFPAYPSITPYAISVGATTELDELAYFSSKGPSFTGRRKPDISAPGDWVLSSVPDSDTSYDIYSGTSMAAPHVAGAVALLLSAHPDFSIDEVKVALYTTTDQKGLAPTNYTCGGTSDFVWPNNQFGHGRLNVLNAYEGFRPAPSAV